MDFDMDSDFMLASTRGTEWVALRALENLHANWDRAHFAWLVGYSTWTTNKVGGIEQRRTQLDVGRVEIDRHALGVLHEWLLGGARCGDPLDLVTVVKGTPGFTLESCTPEMVSNEWQTGIRLQAALSSAMSLTLDLLTDQTSIDAACGDLDRLTQ